MSRKPFALYKQWLDFFCTDLLWNRILPSKGRKILIFFNPYLRTCLLILERREGRESERGGQNHQCERNTDHLPLKHTLTRDQTLNLGMCRESNLWPFILQDDALTNWATLAGAEKFFLFFPQNFTQYISLRSKILCVWEMGFWICSKLKNIS